MNATTETPPVRHDLLDGQAVVYVPMRGKYGAGHEVLVDQETYERLSDMIGRCVVVLNRSGSLSIRLPRVSRQPVRHLAQVISGVPLWAHVTHLDGNPWNLRRSNLGPTGELGHARREAARLAILAASAKRLAAGRAFRAEVKRLTSNGREIEEIVFRSNGTATVTAREPQISTEEFVQRITAIKEAANKRLADKERRRAERVASRQ